MDRAKNDLLRSLANVVCFFIGLTISLLLPPIGLFGALLILRTFIRSLSNIKVSIQMHIY